MMACEATAPSGSMPDHTHTCVGHTPQTIEHFCGECNRWWWQGGRG